MHVLTAKGEPLILPVEGSSAGHAMMMMIIRKVTLLGSSNFGISDGLKEVKLHTVYAVI